jgi:pimeloyl-ACP methyl ester carboxylesterase
MAIVSFLYYYGDQAGEVYNLESLTLHTCLWFVVMGGVVFIDVSIWFWIFFNSSKSMKKLFGLIIGLVIFIPLYTTAQADELEPVVIVPGITGSWNWDVIVRDRVGQGTWGFFPGDRTWNNMILALEDAGYELNENLFIAFYDWRQSNINSATDYLIPTLDKALESSPTGKVNIVAHSMGGLLARRYVQSDGYRDREDINKLIMLGTPNLGSADVYVLWAGGNIPDGWTNIQRTLAGRYLDYLTIKTPGVTDRFDAVRTFIPSVRELLPIYDFLKDSGNNLKSYDDLADTKNPFLENLRGSADRLIDLGGIVTIGGTSMPTVDAVPFVDRELSEIKLWTDGKPEPLTPVPDSAEGDNRVMLSSALLYQFDIEPQLSLNPNIFQKLFAWFLPKAHADLDWDTFLVAKEIESNHGNLPTTSISDVFEALSLEQPTVAYIPPAEPDNIVSFWFASPVQVAITDPQGRIITKDSNDIPGAVYTGETDPNGVKIVLIENGLPGEYKIELTGTGNGEYHILSSITTDEFDEATITQGNIMIGEKHEYITEISTTEPIALEVNEPTITPPASSEDSCSLDDLIARIKERINSSNLNSKAKNSLLRRVDKFEEKLNKRNIDADKLCEIFKKYGEKRDSRGRIKAMNTNDFSSLLNKFEKHFISREKSLSEVRNFLSSWFNR